MVGQRAGEFADELHGLHSGLKAILANAVLHDFEPGVVAALPVYHQTQSIVLDRDDDLLKNCPQDPLTDLGRSRGMVPHPWQVISERQQHLTLVIMKHTRLFAAQIFDLLLEPCHRRQAFISSPFELAGYQPIVGINGIILPARVRLFVARLLQCQFTLPQPFRAGPLMIGDQLECRLDRQW